MRRARHLALIVIALMGNACDLSMRRQPRHDAQSEATLWQGGPKASAPADVVAYLDTAPDTRPSVTPALLERGRERYEIFCTPCHGHAGDGAGAVIARGFPRPPDFQSPASRALTADALYSDISHGVGVMYGFDDRLSARDRWALVLYVRALQQTERPR